jgi:hypothetical protein
MENTKIEEKSQNKYHLLPKSEQFAILQRYRDSKQPSAHKPITTEQNEIIEMTENLFIGEVVKWNLGSQWMNAIIASKP